MQQHDPAFGPMVEVCKAHGIKRSWAFRLSAEGMLETFLIGNKRYVTLESVKTLPSRLAQKQAAA